MLSYAAADLPLLSFGFDRLGYDGPLPFRGDPWSFVRLFNKPLDREPVEGNVGFTPIGERSKCISF